MMCWKSAPPSPALSSATASRAEASALAATRIPHPFGGRFARATTVSSAAEALRSRPGTGALLLYLRYAATGAPARQILGKIYLPEKGGRTLPAHKRELDEFSDDVSARQERIVRQEGAGEAHAGRGILAPGHDAGEPAAARQLHEQE